MKDTLLTETSRRTGVSATSVAAEVMRTTNAVYIRWKGNRVSRHFCPSTCSSLSSVVQAILEVKAPCHRLTSTRPSLKYDVQCLRGTLSGYPARHSISRSLAALQ